MSKSKTGSLLSQDNQERLAILNALVNHPDIRPHMGTGPEVVDMLPFFERAGNLMVGDARGAVCFINLGEAVYGVHWLFQPGFRGAFALCRVREAFNALFTYREAVAITGLIPRDHRASRVMAHVLGCRRIGEAQDASGRSCISYIMERKQWAN